jgi:ribonuclease III
MCGVCTRDEVESIVGFRVRNLTLFQNALIHKSAVKKYQMQSNERLEFIGDAVLNLIVANFLYMEYPDANEGFMTKMRTRIVSGKCLSKIASLMHLDKHVRMNDKALKNGWNTNERIMEDVLESLIGAIYLDTGLQMATKFVMTALRNFVDLNALCIDSNYKDILMRYTQANQLDLPVYAIKHEVGPNHNKQFVVSVELQNNPLGTGVANSKKQAEQIAAHHALLNMDPALLTSRELGGI